MSFTIALPQEIKERTVALESIVRDQASEISELMEKDLEAFKPFEARNYLVLMGLASTACMLISALNGEVNPTAKEIFQSEGAKVSPYGEIEFNTAREALDFLKELNNLAAELKKAEYPELEDFLKENSYYFSITLRRAQEAAFRER